MRGEPYMSAALQCTGLTRCYGGTNLANDNVSFTLQEGEIHALLGENGAGKSTLMKMLYGIEKPDAGTIYIHGREAVIRDPSDAIALGIGMVHQELMLIPRMTAAQNIILGKETTKRFGRLDLEAGCRKIRELASSYGLEIDPEAKIEDLSIGQQQRVEIIKLLYRNADILIFDEPTALLTPQESEALFAVMKRLAALGKSIIFITHKLGEVYQVADCMTVMRKGRVVGRTTPSETGPAALTVMMVGKSVEGERRKPHPIGDTVLDVKGICLSGNERIPALDNVSFQIRKGEILGVAGIEGNGQTQLAQVLLGLIRPEAGEAVLEGQSITSLPTKTVREMGVGSIPDDRKNMGLVTKMRIFENLILDDYDHRPFARGPLLENWKEAHRNAKDRIRDYSIAAADENVMVSELSGGNQQKIVVSRELSGKCRFLIAAQPTRGVDVASASYIQERILEAASGGCAVLLISSDLDELLNLSDRVIVLFRGRISGELDGDKADREKLGRLMLGTTDV